MKRFSRPKILFKHGFVSLVWQFIKFGMVGLLNTLISNGIYYIILLVNENLYMWGYVLGFVISVLNAYFWNSRLVFNKAIVDKQEKPAKNKGKTILRVYISYGLTFILGFALIWLMVEQLTISKYIANLINMIICTPINFLMNKLWAFKETQNREELTRINKK